MSTKWIVGVIMLYLFIFALEMMATGGTTFSPKVVQNSGTLLYQGGVFTQSWATLTNIGTYLIRIVEAFFLFAPTVFVGYLLWFYWFFCFPISCAMVYGIIVLVRGGGGG